MNINRILLLSLIGLLVGCATQGLQASQTSIEKSKVYDAPYDKVWSAIIAGVAESNLSITTLEKESGIIAISNSTYDPSWASEGTRGSVMGIADKVMDRNAIFNILATRHGPDQTRVQVNSNFKMNVRRGNGSTSLPYSYQWQPSYSNGILEQIILDGVERRIQL